MKKKTDAAPEPPTEMGRPPHQATDELKGFVKGWTEAGYGQGEIADRLGIDEKTLRAHYRLQLDFAKMDFLTAVVRSLGRMAVGAPAVYNEQGKLLRAEVVPQPAPAIFILKTQGKKLGWSERPTTDGPMGEVDWSQFSDAEIETIARAQQLLTRNAEAPAAGTEGARTQTH